MSNALNMGFEFHHGIWDIKTALDEHCHDALLNDYIASVFAPPDSTLDLGCGRGDYLATFHRAGWRNLTGVDGTLGIKEFAHFKNILSHDLCAPLDLGKQYELVISLEVGEHLPPEFETVFLENIARHAAKNVLLSWAVEGQKGPGHVNCRNNDYVIERLKALGFNYNARVSSGLRDNSSLPWFANTLMYFQKSK